MITPRSCFARFVPIVVVSFALVASALSWSQETRFRRGDVNADGAIDIADPVAFLFHRFLGQPAALACADAADATDDGTLAVGDAIAILQWLFAGGPALAAPFLECGVDGTADGLGCASFPLCDRPAGTGFVLRLSSVTVMPLSEEELSSIDRLSAQDLALLGLEFDAASREIRSPPLPLSGKWVEIDGERHMSDRDGTVDLEEFPAQTTAVPVFWQAGDEVPVLVLDRIEVVPAGQEPTPSLARIRFKPSLQMDDEGPAGGGGGAAALGGNGAACAATPIPPGCPGTNAVPCCEDHLGPRGDGIRYERTPTCIPSLLTNFYGSQCYIWSFLKRGKPCSNEGAFPWNPGGPGCWVNHKYRNCQNLDENDFKLQPEKKTLKFGERVRFKVRNNTAGNSTDLWIEPRSGEGDIQLAAGAPPVRLAKVGGVWRLDQWNDAQKRFYEEVTLEYIAPRKDADGKCVATYTVHGKADGLKQKFPVRVLPRKNAWRGTAKRSQITDVPPVHNEVIVSADVTFDLDAGEVSGQVTFEETQTDPACFHHGKSVAPITPGANTFFDIDLEADPPRYSGSGATDMHVDLVHECPEATFTTPVDLPDSGWFDAVSGGNSFFSSDDGCQCKDQNDIGVFGASHIFYDWDFSKLPDP